MKKKSALYEHARYLKTGPEAWIAQLDEGKTYWAMLNGPPLDTSRLKERIRNLRELYERAKKDPQVVKPMGMSLVELEIGLIKNLEWLKAGGERHETQYAGNAEIDSKYEAQAKRFERLKTGSAISRRGHPSRRH